MSSPDWLVPYNVQWPALRQIGQTGIARLEPDWRFGQIARLGAPDWRQIAFHHPSLTLPLGRREWERSLGLVFHHYLGSHFTMTFYGITDYTED